MAIPEQYANLVSRLISLTREDKVDWERAAKMGTFGFTATIGDSKVILYYDAESFVEPVVLAIENNRGERVDSFEVAEGATDYSKMKGLWDAARRGALRVDETIAGLERGLEQLGRSEGDPSS